MRPVIIAEGASAPLPRVGAFPGPGPYTRAMSDAPTSLALCLLVGCLLSIATAASAQTVDEPLPGPRTGVVRPTTQTIDEILALEAAAPPLVEDAGAGERLDALHDDLYASMQQVFKSLDDLFADDDSAPVAIPASPFSISIGPTVIKRGDRYVVDVDAEFDVTLKLPNLQRRASVFLTTEDLSEISESKDSGRQAVRTGLRYAALQAFDVELGVKLDAPPVGYAALRWSRRWRQGDWDVQPYAKLFAQTDDGVGASAAFIVNHWRGRTLSRSVSSAKWLHDRRATEWSQSFSLARIEALLEPDQYSARLRGQDLADGWGLRVQAGGADTSAVDYYEVGPFLKQPLHSDWLYLSAQPVVRWERRHGWRADPGLRVGLYALFWGLAP